MKLALTVLLLAVLTEWVLRLKGFRSLRRKGARKRINTSHKAPENKTLDYDVHSRGLVCNLRLPKDWYEYVVVKGVDEARPGIYEWNIDGCGTYIGKYTHISRPVREYGKNVYNLLNGKAYRRSKPDGYRRIHRELAQAHCEGRRKRLTILENVDLSRINERERELIAERGSLNGR